MMSLGLSTIRGFSATSAAKRHPTCNYAKIITGLVRVYDPETVLNSNMRFGALCDASWRRKMIHQFTNWNENGGRPCVGPSLYIVPTAFVDLLKILIISRKIRINLNARMYTLFR